MTHVRFKAAALNHEVGNHAMKQGAFVESVAGVLQKVGGRGRSVGVIEFDADDAESGMQINHDGCLTVWRVRARRTARDLGSASRGTMRASGRVAA